MFENRLRAETRVLAAGGPGQIAERLNPFVTVDDIDPVPHLEPSHKGEDLVRCHIEWMERQPELFMTD